MKGWVMWVTAVFGQYRECHAHKTAVSQCWNQPKRSGGGGQMSKCLKFCTRDWNSKPIFTQKTNVCRRELGRLNPPPPSNSNTATSELEQIQVLATQSAVRQSILHTPLAGVPSESKSRHSEMMLLSSDTAINSLQFWAFLNVCIFTMYLSNSRRSSSINILSFLPSSQLSMYGRQPRSV